jgi:hypothetical protein
MRDSHETAHEIHILLSLGLVARRSKHDMGFVCSRRGGYRPRHSTAAATWRLPSRCKSQARTSRRAALPSRARRFGRHRSGRCGCARTACRPFPLEGREAAGRRAGRRPRGCRTPRRGRDRARRSTTARRRSRRTTHTACCAGGEETEQGPGRAEPANRGGHTGGRSRPAASSTLTLRAGSNGTPTARVCEQGAMARCRVSVAVAAIRQGERRTLRRP